MTLTSVMGAGLSALQAAQRGMNLVSQNVSNINTPGYVRTDIQYTADTTSGGVNVSSIQRAADQFLQAAALRAGSASGAAAVRADLMTRAQTAFGDPSSTNSLFSQLDAMYAAFTAVAAGATDAGSIQAAVSSVSSLFQSIQQTGQSLQGLAGEADQQISQQASVASGLLQQIYDLNAEIRRVKTANGDPSNIENAQSALIDQLSTYMDVKVIQKEGGGVQLRTTSGALLVGDGGAASLSYQPSDLGYGAASSILITDTNGVASSFDGQIIGGSIVGLMQVRDKDIPGLLDALGGLAGATADALNAVHNDSASVPAPSALTGRDTGLLSTDSLGFTGKTTLALTSAAGVLQHKIEIDFTANTITVDGGAPTSYGAGASVGTFVSALNAALGASGAATFSNGVLSLSATGGSGLVLQQDSTTPSARGGRGFAQFFGMNDLVSRATPSFFETGLSAADASGISSGAITFRVTDNSGKVLIERSVSAAGATIGDVVSALNNTSTGIGAYGTFALDSSGALKLTPLNGANIAVIDDSTTRGTTGLSLSSIFGLSDHAAAGRALELQLNPTLAANPYRLAIAHPDLSGAIGTQVLESGDVAGAQALAAAQKATRSIPAAGLMSAASTNLANYASQLAGVAGALASQASSLQASASAIQTAAATQRANSEGVNLDDELVKMTQYQQAYAAASRLIQASKDMYDILLGMTQ